MRLTHWARPPCGCEGLQRRESRAGSRRPRHSCSRPQSSPRGGRAAGAGSRTRSWRGCCRTSPPCHGGWSGQIPGESSEKGLSVILLCVLTCYTSQGECLLGVLYKYTHVYRSVCFEKFHIATKYQALTFLLSERVFFRTEFLSKCYIKSHSHQNETNFQQASNQVCEIQNL